jgi:hypothetical protein
MVEQAIGTIHCKTTGDDTMTAEKVTLPKDWKHATNCLGLLLDRREEFALQQLFAAAHELMELGLDFDDIAEMFDDHLMDCQYSMYQDEAEQSLLRYPFQRDQSWKTCHPECRTTVEHMRRQIESARGVPPTDGALYDRWIASGLSRQMLVATIKHELTLDLSSDEQMLLAVAVHREYRKRRDATCSCYADYPSFADDQDA